LGIRKRGLELRRQPPVHHRHLQLVLEVRQRAEAPQDEGRLPPARVVHEEAVEAVHGDVRPRRDGLAQERQTLLDREHRLLVLVPEDRDDELVHELAAAADEVEVAVRHRIEGPG
jgi:hypothetical protein